MRINLGFMMTFDLHLMVEKFVGMRPVKRRPKVRRLRKFASRTLA